MGNFYIIIFLDIIFIKLNNNKYIKNFKLIFYNYISFSIIKKLKNNNFKYTKNDYTFIKIIFI
jgi:hypothetical protein